MDDLISRQDAIEAIAQYLSRFNLDRDYKQWKGTAKIILDHVLSAQPEPCEDAEFWRKRTEFYSKMCFDLIADMNKGVKIDSVEINEDGIKFTKKQQESCEDAVSRQRLLSDLKELVAAWKKYPVMAEQIKGVETAIGYVEAIPSVKPDSKELSSTHKALDTISRQAAIDALHMHLMYRMGTDSNKKRLDDWINGLPSAQPERKTGRWIKEYWNGEYTRKCSACNITQTVTIYRGKVNFNYCPHCGADMRGEQDESN